MRPQPWKPLGRAVAWRRSSTRGRALARRHATDFTPGQAILLPDPLPVLPPSGLGALAVLGSAEHEIRPGPGRSGIDWPSHLEEALPGTAPSRLFKHEALHVLAGRARPGLRKRDAETA